MNTKTGKASLYRSDEDFWRDLDRLNALDNPYLPWRAVEARKSHIDAFGDTVAVREIHFVKDAGRAFTPAFRLSRSSMEKVLYVAVHLNPTIQGLADKLIQKSEDEFMRKLDQAKP
ncbi:hypothetical protein [Burkholderia pyrrocinia]|uniref:hypothetical protein n=1 Tax=Burkholderia pyrrocinia TaxID=60550 RepID=UPI001BCDEE77|nr:hypothetical protein [Burkholderia pyrrocinia]QVN19583.1 hypothetical protein JYG32_07695 [Burkholderia pyrrocinia]